MTDLSILAHVARLCAAREEVAQRAAAIKASRDVFERTIADDLRLLKIAREIGDIAEADVRALALVEHKRTGNKAPCAGVSVVMTKEYAIDEPAAFAWAQQTKLCLVPESLDVRAIRKLSTVQALPFVTVTEEPAVRVATDLAKALAEVTSGEPIAPYTRSIQETTA